MSRLRCAIGLHVWEFEPRHHRMAEGQAVGRHCVRCAKRQRWLPSPYSMQRGWVDDWLPRPKAQAAPERRDLAGVIYALGQERQPREGAQPPPPIPTRETA